MSKAGNWIPIDKGFVYTLVKIDRAYTPLEAMFSFTYDVDCGREWTIKGYAKLWQWSRNKVRKFVSECRTQRGHSPDTKGTQSGHPVFFIDQGLWVEEDTKGTVKGHKADTKRTPTSNPNPKPNPKPKKKTYGHFANVLLSEDEYKKLTEKFNGSCSEKIEALSEYLKSKGKKYKSHYATILSWDRRDKKEAANGKPKKPGFTEARKSGETNWLGNETL